MYVYLAVFSVKIAEIKFSLSMWTQLLQILIYKLFIDGCNLQNIPK